MKFEEDKRVGPKLRGIRGKGGEGRMCSKYAVCVYETIKN